MPNGKSSATSTRGSLPPKAPVALVKRSRQISPDYGDTAWAITASFARYRIINSSSSWWLRGIADRSTAERILLAKAPGGFQITPHSKRLQSINLSQA